MQTRLKSRHVNAQRNTKIIGLGIMIIQVQFRSAGPWKFGQGAIVIQKVSKISDLIVELDVRAFFRSKCNIFLSLAIYSGYRNNQLCLKFQ